MPVITIVAVLCALGDLILLRLWWRERQHRIERVHIENWWKRLPEREASMQRSKEIAHGAR